jgi:hypothetical protein
MAQYGSWRASADYGQVWVPNGVASGWAPYQEGHWAWVDPWGWTWVDDEPWGFAPFHYGRWAYVDGYWGWCPGPVAVAPIYAPALVAWVGFGGGVGVSFGAGFGGGIGVGWFPLGPRDVYVPPFAASAGFVANINIGGSAFVNRAYVTNAYNTYERTGSVPITSYMNRTVPGAFRVMPENALVGARPVQQAAVRVEAAQINSLRVAVAAPRVAPQLASVMGHPVSGSVARPPAAVLNRPVVARVTPPPAVASFQQRAAVLAQNPGRPIPIAQQRELARTAPGAAERPAVDVVPHGEAAREAPMPTASVPGHAAPGAPPAAAGRPSFEPPTAHQPPPVQAHTVPPAQHVQPQPSYRPPTSTPSGFQHGAPVAHVPPSAGHTFGTAPAQHVHPMSVPAQHVQHTAPPVHHAAPPPQQHASTYHPAPAPHVEHAPPPQFHPAPQHAPPPPPPHAEHAPPPSHGPEHH